MKDKTQKSFRRIARILLLVFCYTFGSHAFALALEHEQTVEIYKVTDVPNPRNVMKALPIGLAIRIRYWMKVMCGR